MEITLKRDHLSHALRLLQQTSDSRPTMPILGAVLLDAEGETLRLTHTTLDHYTTLTIAATVRKPGKIALPLRRLTPIVSELPNLEVRLELDKAVAKVASGGSVFRLNTLDTSEFPPFPATPNAQQLEMTEDLWLRHLRQVAYARSRDESRLLLNGVHVQVRHARVTFTATDGRRLAVSGANLAANGSEGAFTLHPKGSDVFSAFVRKDGQRQIRLSWDERKVAFTVVGGDPDNGLIGDLLCVSSLLVGNYPNTAGVIPPERGTPFKAERALFADTLHRAALATSERSNTVRLTFSPNQVEMDAHSPDFGEAHEQMQVDGASAPPNIKCAFNPGFLLECVQALPHDEITVRVKDEISPAVIEAGDNEFVYVVMPVRL